MKLLVCGGAGYIGSHAVLSLLENGHEVIVADNILRGPRKAVNNGAKLAVGDLRDFGFIDGLLKSEKPEAVLNFAAYHLVGESVAEPIMYYENNLSGTLNLLTAMRNSNIRYLVFSSTAAVYGIPKNIPVTENEPPSPINPYGDTKLAIERLLHWCDGAYGIKSACLRYFNVAGAHKSGEIGEDHKPETHIIPNIIKSVISGDTFKLFGNDYDTPDGTCVRDYIHIDDLIDAHILALDRLMSADVSLLYNLGSKNGYSNMEIIKAVEKVTGKKVSYSIEPRRSGDPDILIASSEKIKTELGWNPKHSLEDMIASAYAWHKSHPDGYKD